MSGLSRDALVERVQAAFPEYGTSQLGSTVNLLVRFSRTMADGDLVLTPEPATRTILFGRVAGAYAFLDESIEAGTDYQHIRPVSVVRTCRTGTSSHTAPATASGA